MRIAERVKVAAPVFPGQNVISVVFYMGRAPNAAASSLPMVAVMCLLRASRAAA